MKYKIKDVISSKITGQWGNECQEGEQGSLVLGVSNLKTDGSFDFSKVAIRSLKGKKLYESLLKNGDILIAKSGNPKVCYFNGPESTYFACNFILTIRPKIDVILNKFLYYSILFIYKTEIIKNCYTSTTIPNLNINSFLDLSIEVPSMSEQRKIIDELSKIDEILPKLDKQLSLFDELVKARFIEHFGDPVLNSKNLPMKPLGELGLLKRGTSKHRPRNDSILLGGPYPLIQTGDVANSGTYITSYTSTYSEEGLKQSKMWDKGTLCITIAANIAQTSILTFDACFPDSVVGFKPNKEVTTMFIHNWFKFLQPILEENAPAVAQKNLNVETLEKTMVIVPNIKEQNLFDEFCEKVDKSKFICQKKIQYYQELMDKKMDEYFGGNCN